MLSTDFVEHVLASIPGRTVGLIGDLFLDRYFDLDAALNEPSVETGLTAYQVTGVRCYPGALGTVLNNLAALGVGRIHPITVIGDDGEGYELRRALAKLPAVTTDDVVVSADRRTPTYSKPMLSEGGAVRELNRLDTKNRTLTPPAVEDEVLKRIDTAWGLFDAVIVLDQVSEAGCGVITTRVRERLAELGDRDPGKFVLADSRERIGLFRNVCVKPNEQELRPAEREPERFGRADRHLWGGGQLQRRDRVRDDRRGDAGAGGGVRQPDRVGHSSADRGDGHGHPGAGAGAMAGGVRGMTEPTRKRVGSGGDFVELSGGCC